MTDLAKLEHIIYLTTEYQKETSRSEKAYLLKMEAWSMQAAMLPLADELADIPSAPITVEENSSDYLKRIKAILEVKS